jgi:hypothetical protein
MSFSFAVAAIFLLIIPRPRNTLLATSGALADLVRSLPEEVWGACPRFRLCLVAAAAKSLAALWLAYSSRQALA